MHIFRRLAGNIFFKIFLAILALSFVFFGVSGFILGNPNSWVVKVGNTTVGLNTFNKSMQNERERILAVSKSEEAMKYLDSDQFKSDVLGRSVNRIMIEKLHDDFGVEASRKLILEMVAKDSNFKNKEGKFDREAFKKFLAKNGLNEEKYVSEVANDITATMIIQTMSMAAPMNYAMLLEAENFKQEKRIADVITISEKNVQTSEKVTDEEVQKYFEKNKQKYAVPELRKVSYLHFSKKDFAKDLQITEAELLAEYEKNKDAFIKPESRNFYQVLFEKEDDAKEFAKKLGAADKSKLQAEFAKLAKETQKKDLKAITLNNFTKKDLIPELAEPTFKMTVNEYSAPLPRPLGYHIFLLNEIKPSQPMAFADVKASLKQKMLEGREDKILQSKITEIDDALLTSNSLADIAKKFNLGVVAPAVTINEAGQNSKGVEVNETKGFADFVTNSFALKKGQVSKVFYAQNSEGFYVLQLEEINVAHERDLPEVKTLISEELNAVKKQEALLVLAKKIDEEIKANPSQVASIVAKYKLKLEKNREFPRVFYINFQGRQIPYQNKFLDDLFGMKIGQVTDAFPSGSSEIMIGILREIKKPTTDSNQLTAVKQKAAEDFRTEILQEFNTYLLKENPVKVNEKLLGKKEEAAK
ncbi:MAG: peptidyl-prolyl cis-trans isomerase [Pseudomonadota bacterium]